MILAGITDPRVILRVLCVESVHDTNYILAMDDKTGEEYYLGNKRSQIRSEKGIKMWNLTTHGYPGTFITSHAQRQSLVIGRHHWTLHNEPKCSSELPYKVEMTLTPCGQDEFNCRNGSCVKMPKRCNQWEDCSDGSDEIDCKVVVVLPLKYVH